MCSGSVTGGVGLSLASTSSVWVLMNFSSLSERRSTFFDELGVLYQELGASGLGLIVDRLELNVSDFMSCNLLCG